MTVEADDPNQAAGPAQAARIALHFVTPPEMPPVFVTNVWVHDWGPEHRAYEVRFHRVDIPGGAVQGSVLPESFDAICAARLVLSDTTMREVIEVLVDAARKRLHLRLTEDESDGLG